MEILGFFLKLLNVGVLKYVKSTTLIVFRFEDQNLPKVLLPNLLTLNIV